MKKSQSKTNFLTKQQTWSKAVTGRSRTTRQQHTPDHTKEHDSVKNCTVWTPGERRGGTTPEQATTPLYGAIHKE